jgi:hypothetical protein
MTIDQKGNLFRELFLIKDFAKFLNDKRDKLDFMNASNSYSLLFSSLSETDIESLIKANVKLGMILAPASQINLSKDLTSINLLCFEKHILNLFTKNEVVAIILHEIGHVFNPNSEFEADDYAVNRGYKEHIISALQNGISKKLEGFDQPINHQRIERLSNL